jgi:toxin-antitoxin system PIN domain toxin
LVIVDANVLLYAVDEGSVHHAPSLSWLESALRGPESVGFAWIVLLAFVRIVTNPGVFARPMGAAEAMAQVERWLAAPGAVVVEPTPRHATLLKGLLDQAGTAGNLTNDAHLAALVLENGAEIVSYDRDFARFPGIRHRLPEA